MFNRKSKRIKELEQKLLNVENDNAYLHSENSMLRLVIEEAANINDTAPSDCKLGPWCESCSFSKCFLVRDRWRDPTPLYVCGKSETCNNYVQKNMEVTK